MIVRINDKVERALRDAIDTVPHVEEDQIGAPLDKLDHSERIEALSLALLITCYVMVDVCGSTWPVDSTVRSMAEDMATTSSNARRLRLDPEQVYAYLSRTVLGQERLEDVIPDEPWFTRLPIIVAGEALAVYAPKGKGMWGYLDQIESALEIADALDPSVFPAAVMHGYLRPPATGEQEPGT